MSARTAAVLDAARAVEAEADRELSLARLMNPAAIAWLEDNFDRRWDAIEALPYLAGDSEVGRAYSRPMVELLEEDCDHTPCRPPWAPSRWAGRAPIDVNVGSRSDHAPAPRSLDLADLEVLAFGRHRSAGIWRHVLVTLGGLGVRPLVDWPTLPRPHQNRPPFALSALIDETTRHETRAITYRLSGWVSPTANRVETDVALALAAPGPDHLVDPASRVPGVIAIPTTEQALAHPWDRAPLLLPDEPPLTGPPVGRLR